MSRPRRKMFGPLFYTTVVVAVLLTALTEVYTGFPAITEWLTERSLIRALRADDTGEREAAATTLVKQGSGSVVPQLIEAARDQRADLRAMACRYLIRTGTELDVLVPVLVAAASDVDENVRYEAACAFGFFFPPSVTGQAQLIVPTHRTMSPSLRSASIKALRRLLHDHASLTRIAAAAALGLLGPDPEAIADLSAATGDNDRDVRFAAARALLKVGGASDRSAGRALVALVADPEPIADRRAVLDVVLSAGKEVQDQAVAALARLLANVDLPDDNNDIHGDVIDCLVACGPRARSALPLLDRFLENEIPAERATAGIAFATIGGHANPRAIPILLKIIDDLAIAPDSRQAALEKIRELNEAELVKATPILIRQLGSTSAAVRLTAIGMLHSIIENTPAELPAPPTAQ
jgi:HEAT repeat protein